MSDETTKRPRIDDAQFMLCIADQKCDLKTALAILGCTEAGFVAKLKKVKGQLKGTGVFTDTESKNYVDVSRFEKSKKKTPDQLLALLYAAKEVVTETQMKAEAEAKDEAEAAELAEMEAAEADEAELAEMEAAEAAEAA